MRTTLIIFLTILISSGINAQEILTLEEAISVALHNNSTFLKSSAQIDGYESGVQEAYGNFLPTLGVGASWDWSRSDVEGVGTIIINGVPIPRVATTSTSRSYRGFVYSDWTLFDGLANISALSKSQSDLESAEFSLERVKQDIVFTTISPVPI